MIDVRALAAELHSARLGVVPVALLTERHPDLDWDRARAIARECDRLRVSDGEEQIGWKLGWTSEAMRAALGVDRPNWGTLWHSHVVDGSVPRAGFLHPKLEPELVYRARGQLRGPVTGADVAADGGEWALGIEVVDPRFPSFRFDALDNTADNSSAAAIAVGEFRPLDAHAVAGVEVTWSDGRETRTGAGAQAMGSPLEAVAWLVRNLADEGLSVRAGDLVFTGGLTAPCDAAVGRGYSVEAPGFEAVSLTFY